MASLAAATENENKTVYFLSHVQAESKDVALELFYSMKEKGKSCWLDVKMKERDEDAMKKGVKLCEVVLIIMSPNYFNARARNGRFYGRESSGAINTNHRNSQIEFSEKIPWTYLS